MRSTDPESPTRSCTSLESFDEKRYSANLRLEEPQLTTRILSDELSYSSWGIQCLLTTCGHRLTRRVPNLPTHHTVLDYTLLWPLANTGSGPHSHTETYTFADFLPRYL